jgi:hypothetical protein
VGLIKTIIQSGSLKSLDQVEGEAAVGAEACGGVAVQDGLHLLIDQAKHILNHSLQLDDFVSLDLFILILLKWCASVLHNDCIGISLGGHRLKPCQMLYVA